MSLQTAIPNCSCWYTFPWSKRYINCKWKSCRGLVSLSCWGCNVVTGSICKYLNKWFIFLKNIKRYTCLPMHSEIYKLYKNFFETLILHIHFKHVQMLLNIFQKLVILCSLLKAIKCLSTISLLRLMNINKFLSTYMK